MIKMYLFINYENNYIETYIYLYFRKEKYAEENTGKNITKNYKDIKNKFSLHPYTLF